MIELYTAATSNGLRPAIMLAECGLAHRLIKVDLDAGDQKQPDFLALNPLAQIPVMVDDGAKGGRLVLSESTAILVYLAETSGFGLPTEVHERARTLEALANVMSDVYAPMNAGFYLATPGLNPPKAVLATFEAGVRKALGHWDMKLARSPWLAGAFSIADIALYPNLLRLEKPLGWRFLELANLMRWANAMAGRAGVGRALAAAGWS